MLKIIAACMALALMTAGGAQARRFVAYSVRSTDWDGNHGFNALWVLDRSSQNSVPRLVRLKPQNSVQWYATVESWMKRWLGS